MALYSLINNCSRSHLQSRFCRYFCQRNIAIWKTFNRPTCEGELFDSTRSPVLAASCAGITKHFSIWSKHSFLYPCQNCRERRFNVSLNKSALHCSRSLLQEEFITQQSIKDELESEILEGNTTLNESLVSEDVTKQYCRTSEVTVDTATENINITESLTSCTVERTRSTLSDTQTSSTRTRSKKESSSQAPVTLTAGLLMYFKTLKSFILQSLQSW